MVYPTVCAAQQKGTGHSKPDSHWTDMKAAGCAVGLRMINQYIRGVEVSKKNKYLAAQQISLFPTVSALSHPSVPILAGALSTAAALLGGLPTTSELDLQPATNIHETNLGPCINSGGCTDCLKH